MNSGKKKEMRKQNKIKGKEDWRIFAGNIRSLQTGKGDDG